MLPFKSRQLSSRNVRLRTMDLMSTQFPHQPLLLTAFVSALSQPTPPPPHSCPHSTKRVRAPRCRYRIGVRLADHRLCAQPVAQAATVLVRHSGIRPVWGHGPVLLDDGLPAAVRVLRSVNTSKQPTINTTTTMTNNNIIIDNTATSTPSVGGGRFSGQRRTTTTINNINIVRHTPNNIGGWGRHRFISLISRKSATTFGETKRTRKGDRRAGEREHADETISRTKPHKHTGFLHSQLLLIR